MAVIKHRYPTRALDRKRECIEHGPSGLEQESTMSSPAPHQGPNGNNWREYIEALIRRATAMSASALAQIAALSATQNFAEFFGLTTGTGNAGPNDYAATIAVKTVPGSGRVPFPRNGPTNPGSTVVRTGPAEFVLPDIGFYRVQATIHTTEGVPGQFELELNGVELPYTTAPNMNPTAGGHPHFIDAIVQTTTPNELLAIINPPGNAAALTITPADGASTHANAQTLIIQRIG